MAREIRTFGEKVDFDVHVYDGSKYTAKSLSVKVVTYRNVVEWHILTDDEAKEVESLTDENSWDENHEYLELHFENGETATFRDSYVDMFRSRSSKK